MRNKKIYGQSQTNLCPWCGSNATAKTGQGVPCCRNHTKAELPDIKCVCGDWLDVAEGKYGAYFRCLTCGNKSFNKGLEMNGLVIGSVPNSASEHEPKNSVIEQSDDASRTRLPKQSKPKEIIVTSDEVDFIFEKYG